MDTNFRSLENAALSRRDALRLLDIIHESLFCTTEGEFKRIVEDVKNMVRVGSAAHFRNEKKDDTVEDVLPFERGARKYTPRVKEIIRHVGPHLRRKFAELSEAGAGDNCAAPLTSREREILLWVKEGKGTWEIASILGISRDTVKFHIKNIFRKLNVTSRSQAVAIALGRGLIDP